jgi:hypothetical protein
MANGSLSRFPGVGPMMWLARRFARAPRRSAAPPRAEDLPQHLKRDIGLSADAGLRDGAAERYYRPELQAREER